jgi:predicted transcriptional regulator of viral defense system
MSVYLPNSRTSVTFPGLLNNGSVLEYDVRQGAGGALAFEQDHDLVARKVGVESGRSDRMKSSIPVPNSAIPEGRRTNPAPRMPWQGQRAFLRSAGAPGHLFPKAIPQPPALGLAHRRQDVVQERLHAPVLPAFAFGYVGQGGGGHGRAGIRISGRARKRVGRGEEALAFVSDMHYKCCILESTMNWHRFRETMFDLGCFSIHQVYAWDPGFDRNNFIRWIHRGYLVRLRRGLYAFAEYRSDPEMATYFAGRIYRPSYVSLHSALSFYGLIPESVVQITSVASLKTAVFSNGFGEYTYGSIREDLMFGYEPRRLANGRTTPYASREKALLDLLYLYPFYRTEEDMAELRLDPDVLHKDFDRAKWASMTDRFRCAALEQRARLLSKVYDL